VTPPAWAYFDTSALLKRYVWEAGSVRTRALLRRHRVISSALMPVETLSALSRRRALGDLTARDYDSILQRIERDRIFWELVELTADVLDRAEDLVRQTALRTLNAIHVASALTVHQAGGMRLAFVTADAVQREAVVSLPLELIWIG
jgi:predicted nucleic acid-binding protein